MLGKRYVVKKGDTLWDLSGKFLGNPARWPEIHQHNNTPQVCATSGSKIVDPDVILIGQVIYIPEKSFPKPPQRIPGPPRPAGKKDRESEADTEHPDSIQASGFTGDRYPVSGIYM